MPSLRSSELKASESNPLSLFEYKLDQVHLFPRPVLGGFEQIDDPGETGAARELRRDVVQGDLPHARDAYEPVLHHITPADLHLRPLPDTDGAGDLAARNRLAQPLQEADAH